LARRLSETFALYGPTEPVLGTDAGRKRAQVYLFLGVLAGAASKIVYDSLTEGATLDPIAFLVAIIISLVIFPQLYYAGGLDRRKLSFAHWTLAFQNGFFCSIAFAELVARASAS
jgi:hypothetical protein